VSSPNSIAQQARLAENRFVIHYRCPDGGRGCATGIAEPAGQPCGFCAAKATWQVLSAETRQVSFGVGSHYCAQPKPLILRGHTLAVRW